MVFRGKMAAAVLDAMSAPKPSPADLYYLQDRRTTVGNSMVWWAKDCQGYVCDIRKAHVFTREEAFGRHATRNTDMPWPKAYIDARVSHHIDFQNCDRADINTKETA